MTQSYAHYTFDPCPECGVHITGIKSQPICVLKYEPLNFGVTVSDPISLTTEYEVCNELQPCGHKVKVDNQTRENGDVHVALVSIHAPDSSYAIFRDAVRAHIGALPGWKFEAIPESMSAVSIIVTCRHGHRASEWFTLPHESTNGGKEETVAIANYAMTRYAQQCSSQHNDAAPDQWPVYQYPPYSPLAKKAGKSWSPIDSSWTTPVVHPDWPKHPIVAALCQIIPSLRTAMGDCPACHIRNAPVAMVVVHLNDQHKWTREQIADWLDTLDVDLTVRPKETQDVIYPTRETHVSDLVNPALLDYVIYGNAAHKPNLTGIIGGAAAATS